MKREDLQEILDLLNAIQAMPAGNDLERGGIDMGGIITLAEKVKAELQEPEPEEVPEFEGVPMTIGRRRFIIPSFNLKRLKQIMPEIDKLKVSAGTLSDEESERLARIVHTALQRNYPKITMGEVEELVDLRNFKPLLAAIMGQSGLVETKGEKLAGE